MSPYEGAKRELVIEGDGDRWVARLLVGDSEYQRGEGATVQRAIDVLVSMLVAECSAILTLPGNG